MKIALDTNVLVYMHDVGNPVRRQQAVDIVTRLAAHTTVLPVQVLGEFYRVLVRKFRMDEERVVATIVGLSQAHWIAETGVAAFFSATDLARKHRLQIWDALILAVAEEAGCVVLLSEDMQDGFQWGGVTVCNPFAPEPHPLLAALRSDP